MIYYHEYIASKEWKRKADWFRRFFFWQCQRCFQRGWQVHHKHYRTLGDESVTDVELLCDRCHRQAHELPPES